MSVLLTRRQTLQSLAAAAVYGMVGGASLFSLAGCGGGGNDGGGPVQTTSMRVAVELPAGFSLPLAELEAGTAFGAGAVADGGFSARVAKDAPTFAYLRHKPSGKHVLFGLVGPGRPGLTPLGCAAGTMALAMGYTGLAPKELAAALALLEADSNIKGLGDAIASAMATDPYAVVAEGGAVAGATKAAFDALRGPAAPAAPAAARTGRTGSDPSGSGPSGAGTKGRGRAPAPLLLVQPSGESGGVRVDQGSPGQIFPTNLKRRPAAAYTYRVGHDPGAGAGDSAPAVRVNQQDLVATTSFVGSLLSLSAKPAYAEVDGQPFDLTVEGQDKKTFYETVVLMGSANWGTDPDFFASPRYAAELPAWRAKVDELNRFSFNEIMVDVFKTVGSGSLAALTFASSAAINGELARTLPPLVGAAFAKGRFTEVMYALLRGILGGNDASRRVVVFALGRLGYPTAFLQSAQVAASIVALAEFALASLVATGAILGAADFGTSVYDSAGSPPAERFGITALKADLTITPATGTIAPGATATLKADVVGRPAPSTTVYTWAIAGGSDLATLSDARTGKAGRKIETPSDTVTLATTPSTQGDITVTCEAFLGDDIVGPATAKLTVEANAIPVSVVLDTIPAESFSSTAQFTRLFFAFDAPAVGSCEISRRRSPRTADTQGRRSDRFRMPITNWAPLSDGGAFSSGSTESGSAESDAGERIYFQRRPEKPNTLYVGSGGIVWSPDGVAGQTINPITGETMPVLASLADAEALMRQVAEVLDFRAVRLS